jgi:hypothetical protein
MSPTKIVLFTGYIYDVNIFLYISDNKGISIIIFNKLFFLYLYWVIKKNGLSLQCL